MDSPTDLEGRNMRILTKGKQGAGRRITTSAGEVAHVPGMLGYAPTALEPCAYLTGGSTVFC